MVPYFPLKKAVENRSL